MKRSGEDTAELQEIADAIGVASYQCVQGTLRRAQHKVAAQLLQRLGHAVVDLVRDSPMRHDDPRRLR